MSMIKKMVIVVGLILSLGCSQCDCAAFANTYYISSKSGSDSNNGLKKDSPFKTLERISELGLTPGDKILFASGDIFSGTLNLNNISGTEENPILISSYESEKNKKLPIIDSKEFSHGIVLKNCSHVIISNIEITGNGGAVSDEVKQAGMRCGVLVTTSKIGVYKNIQLINLVIHDIFFENEGFIRGKDEVLTSNGTQSYGWGIRFINSVDGAVIRDVLVENCLIENVDHTGIKFTGKGKNIHNIKLYGNRVNYTGGPGIQMSGVHVGHIFNNHVNRSGSNDDSRKWGRGSGLWTWGSSDIVIEKSSFRNANGPGDSAGCHIDFNCNNVIVQYCLSEGNAGGFCEILGNNYNCAYRYNISINDGYRVKGIDGFQEGKIFWLSGYVGKDQKRNGPFNSYFYNNTIYVKKQIEAKFAIDKASKGVLIANNIFHIEGESKLVLGDQYVPDAESELKIENVFFRNNLFLKTDNWPKEISIQDDAPLIGNPGFSQKGGTFLEDYIPTNKKIIKDKGIVIPKIPGDELGLFVGLDVHYDILGNKIIGPPDMGAIEIK